MSPAVSTGIKRTFRSLHAHRNYRLYFVGQVISLIGTWMQALALPWFILQLTHSAVAVGFLAFCQYGPYMLFGLLGGAIVDRLNTRITFMTTQAISMCTAALLSTLAFSHITTPWPIYLIAVINGITLVIDNTSRQAFTIEMVGRAELPNAVALNAGMYNGSRVVGPAVAGVLIAVVGVGMCFAINALSFLGVITCLLAMRTDELHHVDRDHKHPPLLRGAVEGLTYAWRTPTPRMIIGMLCVLASCGINFNVILPVVASTTLHENSQTFGILSACFGTGALLGALCTATLGRSSFTVLFLGGCAFALAQLALALQHTVLLYGLVLVCTGFVFILYTSMSNATIQMAIPDRLRGRIFAIYGYAYYGTAPIGGLLAGWICQHWGTQTAFLVDGSASAIAVVVGLRYHLAHREEMA